jgi:preprotein translocase subunit SecA
MRHDYLTALISNSIPHGTLPEEWNLNRLKQDLFSITGLNLPVEDWAAQPNTDSEDMVEKILTETDTRITDKNKNVPQNIVRLVEKSIVLQSLDQLWKEHIATLELMRHTIVLRAYGQKDPLNEYKREAFNMFSDMLDILKEKITVITCHATIQTQSGEDVREQELRRQNQKMSAFHEQLNGQAPVAPETQTTVPEENGHPEWKNISRNSPCPCGSGKKYKHCHGKVA